jgi:hypothetical protein
VTVIIVCRFGNGADYLPAWFAHHRALADGFVVSDNRSHDGSRRFLKDCSLLHSEVETVLVDSPWIGRLGLTTALTNRAFQRGADWVIPLDQDEFLPYSTKKELLKDLGDSGVVKARRKNIAPSTLLSGERPSWTGQFLTSEKLIAGKVFISRSVASEYPKFWIERGNHSVLTRRYGSPLEIDRWVKPLLHVPIISRNQFSVKSAYRSAVGKPLAQGAREYESNEELLSLALNYPSPTASPGGTHPYIFTINAPVPECHFQADSVTPASEAGLTLLRALDGVLVMRIHGEDVRIRPDLRALGNRASKPVRRAIRHAMWIARLVLRDVRSIICRSGARVD